MLYFRSIKIVQHNIIVVCCILSLLIISVIFYLGDPSIPAWILDPLGYVACFLNLSFDVLPVICRLHILRPIFKISFYLVPPIVFSFRALSFFYFGAIRRLPWYSTYATLNIPWKPPYEYICVCFTFQNLQKSSKCWILLKPVLGVGGNLQLSVPSMNRLNQTEPTTFCKLFWAFFMGFNFSVFG